MTRLRDGESVALGYGWVVKGIRKCLAGLRTEGFEIIALLCTCHFSELEDEKGLIQISKLVEEKVKEMVKKGRLGVLIPSAEQILQTEKRWQRPGVKVIVASASPYGPRDEVISAVNSLAKHQVDLIVLDCIGYNLSVCERIKKTTSIPVILPLQLLAQALKKLTSLL
jgi:protein AroM